MDPVRLALTRGWSGPSGWTGTLEVVAAPRGGGLDAAAGAPARTTWRRCGGRSADPAAADRSYGLGTMDDPAFAGMHEVSALIAGQSVGAAEAVWRGEARTR